MIVRWSFAALLYLPFMGVGADAGDERGRLEFFESKIRPVLVEHCYECHSAGANTLRGGLMLDSREGTRTGGDSGAAVVPGQPEESLLLQALRYETFEMPPSGKLPQSVIKDFQTWIETGAADPREAPASAGRPATTSAGIDIEAGRQFWSFQPVRRHDVPRPQTDEWGENDIDCFLLAQMESAGLKPAVDADRRTLLRRAYFDLIGLPPTPESIQEFLADDSPPPIAFARVVDEL
ncbi:MAG: DUF1549 domain-containing protein, partial [Planctomycetaceae bacterium]